MFTVQDKISHTLLTHSQLQSLSNILHWNSQHGSLIPVDIDCQLRFCKLQIHIRHRKHRTFINLIHKTGQHTFQIIQIFSLYYIFHRQTSSSSTKRLLLRYHRPCSRKIAHLQRQFIRYFLLCSISVFRSLQPQIHIGTVRISTANHLYNLILFRNFLFNIFTQFIGIPHHIIKSRTFRSSRINTYIRAVLQRSHLRRKSCPQQPNHNTGTHQHQRSQPPHPHKCIQRPAISVYHPLKQRLRLMVEPVIRHIACQQLGRNHRSKGQCHKRRYHHSTCNDHTKLPEQATCSTLQKDNRHKYRHQSHRCRNHSEKNLIRTFMSCLQRRHSLLDFRIDILHHNNCIIHHQTDSQHNRQQRQNINWKISQIHHKESTH